MASNPFDGDASRLLCLPRGLLFAKEGHVPDPQFHSFLVTKEDGSHVYGSSLTFYELVTTEKVLHALEMLQTMYKQDVLTQRGSSPQRVESEAVDSGDFEFDRERGDKIYVSQCVSLVSQIPFVWPYEQYLSQLYDVSRSNDAPLPLESYIHNLLFEVPLPPPGRSLRLMGPRGPITCIRPSMERSLPLLEYSIRKLFDWLSLDDVILVFTCFLLEHQILLVASQYHRLMTIAECISSLMLPFSWQHVYVPILPQSLRHYLDAPVPFIMGLQQLPGDEPPDVPGEVVTVNLDTSQVCRPEEVPDLPGVDHLKLLIEMKLKDSTNSTRASSRRASVSSQAKLSPLPEEDVTSPKSEREVESPDEGEGKNSVCEETEDKHEEKKPERPQSIHPQLAKMLQLAKRAGIETSISHLLPASEEAETDGNGTTSPEGEEQGELEVDAGIMLEKQADIDFNSNIREIFLQHFVQLFADYDKFVIPPCSDYETWLSSREQLQNFDKAAFLSDQPERHLPFLSPFLETQAFASLIDNKIQLAWNQSDPQLALFDAKIHELKQNRGVLRSPSEEMSSQKVHFSLQRLSLHNLRIDHRARPPRQLNSVLKEATVDARGEGAFARLQFSALLNQRGSEMPERKSRGSWSRNQRRLQQWEHLLASNREIVQEARQKTLTPHPALGDSSPESMNKSQGSFVLRLLKEARMKVKRLLVQKMGREAFIMGHGELRGKSVKGVEENTLIASLCDLLERIWSHGLNVHREARSCLWSHLMAYVSGLESKNQESSSLHRHYSLPSMHNTPSGALRKWSAGATVSVDGDFSDNERQSKLASFRNWAFGSPEMRRRIGSLLAATPPDIQYDLECVQKMAEIKTEVGLARAWIRLALEKKQLADHLKSLLSDDMLVTERYRDYAFLRSEDEREQFLFHLLSLTTVDFHCFTLGFANTIVTYRIAFVTGRSLTSSTTTANVWLMLSGEHGDTGRFQIPRGEYEVELKHSNLGLLTTLRIGHDNMGIKPGIFVEMLVVRNLVTDTVWKFPCGRWLSRGEDDGSIQRLLVGEMEDRNSTSRGSREGTPPRSHSPKMPRKDDRCEETDVVDEILQALADVVNRVIKHCSEPEAHGSVSFLLCGEKGLCQAMHNVFLYNLRSRRFRSNLLPWDFIQKVYESHSKLGTSGTQLRLSTSGSLTQSKLSTSGDQFTSGELTPSMQTFISTVAKISSASKTIGKDGKFQAFVCLAARDCKLADWMAVLSQSNVAESCYEPSSFVRKPQLTSPLLTTLSALNDMNIKLEASILKGIEDN